MSAFLEIPVLPQRTIALHPPLTDDEFERMSEHCDGASLERSKEGAIIVNPPAGHSTSDANSEINRQLRNWWIRHRHGRTSDSSGGFFLPDGSSLNPDAAYVTSEQLQGITQEDRTRFLRLAPAFVIELRSPSDSLGQCMKKMKNWMANGVEVGWLVDPYAKQVHVYEQGASSRVESGLTVAGSGPVEGFALDLEEVWRCFE